MFWITGSGLASTLEEGNLDGSGLKTLLGQCFKLSEQLIVHTCISLIE
jgi:hypothetical protein